MRTEFFFAIAGHNVTVVGSDASYTKPYKNEYIMITPGQTFDLLFEANSSIPYCYYIYATPYFDGLLGGPRNPNATVAILEYKTNSTTPPPIPMSPSMPNFDNISAATMFTVGLRSLASSTHPVDVPQTVDVSMYITLAVNKKQYPTGGTNILGAENHPMHLHGHIFYVVGSGFGNFNNQTDPLSYNLVDPPRGSTIGVPKNGWATIRFRATNPGVWFMHCHVDRHMVWGMEMVFITKNGNITDAKILPPPADKPRC
ncbi:hypothetical protein LUZ61_004244 [Rhynchospora tenuis]|uniref:Laccase n=1 Tax=Rhynchospora tenuis TaxID=198213 RepID=A0AAD6ETI9_9POAL|nr:hypothetical protein LUZ61_004244 [Rhynchospora tenuis]